MKIVTVQEPIWGVDERLGDIGMKGQEYIL